MYKIIIAICIFSSVAFGSDEIKSIKDIKKEYGIVQKSLNSYKTSSFEVNDLSTEGGELTYYKDKSGNVRVLKAELLGETGKDVIFYYFKNGELFFVYRANFSYNAPIYDSSFDNKKTYKSVDRFYFVNSDLVRWINNKDEIHDGKMVYENGQMIINKLIKILLKSK
jgi:hypothetical protein